jgi:hypothetical protein
MVGKERLKTGEKRRYGKRYHFICRRETLHPFWEENCAFDNWSQNGNWGTSKKWEYVEYGRPDERFDVAFLHACRQAYVSLNP